MTVSTAFDREMLAATLRRQHEVIARYQVITCRMSEQALRYRLRPDGPWQRVLPGVYLARTGTPTIDQRDMAALLYAGPGSAITGCAALRRLGIRAPSTDLVDVLVSACRRRQSVDFVRVQRTTRMPDVVCVSGSIRFTFPARAVGDAARGMAAVGDIRAVVAGSVQQRRCLIQDIARELSDGPKPGSAGLRRVLAEVADGVRSAVEAEFRGLVKRAGLPMPMFNARLYAGEVLLAVADAWWPDAGVAAEIDSREWHLSAEDWQRTMRRHARLTAAGIRVLHFTPQQIRAEPAEVVGTLRAALGVGRAAGQPSVRALPAVG